MRPFQLFDSDGNELKGQSADRDDVFKKGMLHGAAHVWIYRLSDGKMDILLQKRSMNKINFPGLLDASAAGHIDVGEDAITAAVRETSEELGLDIKPTLLKPLGRLRVKKIISEDLTENEFIWVYVYLSEMPKGQNINIQKEEVDSAFWKPFQEFKSDLSNPKESIKYVPQGSEYYDTVIHALNELL